MISSTAIPENIRRRMQPEDRRELKVTTQPEADTKFNQRREKELQQNIANLLSQRNITFFRQRMDKRTTGKVGQPDFLFAINGHACAVEVKTPEGQLTAVQKNILIDLQENGWKTWIARGEAEFLSWLNDVEKEVGSNG